MSEEFHFFPGSASDRLEDLAGARGISKAAVLRELIAGAPMRDLTIFHATYARITTLGRQMADLASEPGEIPRIAALAQEALSNALKLGDIGIPAHRQTSKVNLLRRARQKESAMTFRPLDQEEKLNLLSLQTGLGKSATLRALVLGIRLPSTQVWKTYARISQVGGLAKHIAFGWKDRWERMSAKKPWLDLLECGFKLRDLACGRLHEEVSYEMERGV